MIPAEQNVEVKLGRDRLGDRQQLDFLALRPRSSRSMRNACSSAFAAWRLIASARARSAPPAKIARALVQHLGHTDRLAVAVAQRDAQDIAGAIAGLAVDLGVEARIPVDVGDDLGDPGRKHRAGNSGGRRHPNLRHAFAAQHARKQRAILAIVEKQRCSIGVERFGDQIDQTRQLAVEGQRVRHGVGDLGQHSQPPVFFGQLLG